MDSNKRFIRVLPPRVSSIATTLALILSMKAPDASGALTTYLYSGTTGGQYSWSSGEGFATSPLSGEGAAIEFYTGMRAGNGVITIDSINDISDFRLSRLALSGTGAATSGTTIINLSGKSLHFLSDGEAPATFHWGPTTTGVRTLSYTISNNIGISGSLQISSNAARTLTNSFFGDGALVSPSGSSFTLRGATGAETFYRGDIIVNSGVLTIGNPSLLTLPSVVTTGTLTIGSGATVATTAASFFAAGGAVGTGKLGSWNSKVFLSNNDENTFDGTFTSGMMIYKGGVGELKSTVGFENGSGELSVFGGSVTMKEQAGLTSSHTYLAQGTVQFTGTGITKDLSGKTYENLLGTHGYLHIYGGAKLMITPEGGSSEEDLYVTGNIGRIQARGGTLSIDKGNWKSLTVGFGAQLESIGDGASLLFHAAGGLGALGSTEKVIFATKPTSYNGIMAPNYLGVDNDEFQSANFLVYDNTDGVKPFTNFTFTNAIASSGSNAIIDITAGETVTMAANRDINGLRTSGTLELGNYALSFKARGAGRSGLILNGGVLSGGTINSEGLAVYTSLKNGAITGRYNTGLLTKLGDGTLSMEGNVTSTSGINVVGGAIHFTNNTNGLSLNGWSKNLKLIGGAVETNGSFLRDIGTGENQVSLGYGYAGGFSARGGNLDVNLGNNRRTLTWSNVLHWNFTTGSGSFLQDGATLLLNSRTATHHVNLQNHLNLGGSTGLFERIIEVRKGVGTATAEISGNIASVGYANGVVKSGDGSLLLSGSNTFQGNLTISKGTVKAGSAEALSTSANRVVVQKGATLDLNGQTINHGKKIILNGSGDGGLGALINNGSSEGVLGDGISLNVVESSGQWDLSQGLPVITITGGDGSGSSATVNGLIIRDISVLQSGTFSTDVFQTIAISNGLKEAVALTRAKNAAADGSGPTGVTIMDPGLFNVNPSIEVGGGLATTPAELQANLALNLEGIDFNPGSGYTVAPKVTVSGGTGNATILAEVGEVQLASDSSVGGSGNLWIKPVVTGTGKLTKIGAGTLTLSGNNKYSGGTQISAGKVIASHQSALGLGAVAVGNNAVLGVTATIGNDITLNGANARLIVDGRANGNIQFGANGGRLEGSGTVGSALALDNTNQTLAPGNSPGTLTLEASQNWSAFTYEWEINQWSNGVAGTNYDQVIANNAITLASDGSFTLKLRSLTNAGADGALSDFSETAQQWVIIAATNVVGFEAANWTLDLSAFTTPEEWAGVWSLQRNEAGILLDYAIPEPSTYLSIFAGGALLYGLHRRRAGSRAKAA